MLLTYRSRRYATLTLVSAVRWYRWQAAGLIAQAAVLGFQSLRAFASNHTAAALLSLGFVTAFCAGACVRVSVVPWIPITTSLLLLVPTIYGALMSSELPIKHTGIFLIVAIPVMTETTLPAAAENPARYSISVCPTCEWIAGAKVIASTPWTDRTAFLPTSRDVIVARATEIASSNTSTGIWCRTAGSTLRIASARTSGRGSISAASNSAPAGSSSLTRGCG